MTLSLGSDVAGWLCLPGSQARDGARVPDLLVVCQCDVSRAPLKENNPLGTWASDPDPWELRY